MKFRIVEKYTYVPISSQMGVLSAEDSSQVVRSPMALAVLQELQQQHQTRQGLLDRLSNRYARPGLIQSIYLLEEKGFITCDPAETSTAESAFWWALDHDPQVVREELSQVSVSVMTLGGLDKTPMEEALRASGFSVSEESTLTIVLTHTYLDPELSAINEEMIAEGKPWILVKPTGKRMLIGPLFRPDQEGAACWKCLQQRMLLNDQGTLFYQQITGSSGPLPRPVSFHPANFNRVIWSLIPELWSWVLEDASQPLNNCLLEIGLQAGIPPVHHQIVQRPQCPHCGDTSMMERPPTPIRLQSQLTNPDHLGGYRCVSHEETLEKYKHHVSPITGIVPKLDKIEVIPDGPIHNYSSGKNIALQSRSMFWLNMHQRTGNGGKGKTDIQAKTGALCEAIERYSGMYHGKTHSFWKKMNEVENAIHPNDVMQYSPAQFANRDLLNRNSNKFYEFVPIPFDPEKEYEWTPVYSLTSEQFWHMPTGFCFAQYPEKDETRLFSYPDSNGLAAGNSLEEAILQGFLELVERDAAAIWWYNRLQRPQVDLPSLANPYIDQIIQFYWQMGRRLHVLDITNDLGIPSFVAISYRDQPNESEEIVFAFGTHYNPYLAVERAVVEVNQLLTLAIKENGDYRTPDPVFKKWLKSCRFVDEPWLSPSEDTPILISEKYGQSFPKDIDASLAESIRLIREIGHELLVLDLTQPDVGMPVARVIVPGLRHFWKRTAPGRLYDVPVKMGWTEQPLTEEDLNPVGIFI